MRIQQASTLPMKPPQNTKPPRLKIVDRSPVSAAK
jgi:hypothetical protein